MIINNGPGGAAGAGAAGTVQISDGAAALAAAAGVTSPGTGRLAMAQGTITTALSPLAITETRNAAGVTFPGMVYNITDSAAANGSNMLDFQVGGVSWLSFTNKSTIINDYNYALTIGRGTSWPLSISNSGAQWAKIAISTTATYIMNHGGLFAIGGNSPMLAFGTSNSSGMAFLTYDAANILAQRNGTAAQEFRLYNTFTDASNYERGFMRWSSNTLQIGTEKAGTGVARNLELQTDGTTRLSINATGPIRTSNQPFYVNASFDTGISSSTDGWFLHLNNRYGTQVATLGDQWLRVSRLFATSSFVLGNVNGSNPITLSINGQTYNVTDGSDAYLTGGIPSNTTTGRSASSVFIQLANGNSSTLTNTNGGKGGAFDIQIGAGGAGNGTGVTGTNGYFAVKNTVGTNLFNIDYTGNTTLTNVILKGSTSGAITLQSPATVTNYTLTLPTSAGAANQVLTTNGTGILSWATVSGGGGGTKTWPGVFNAMTAQPPASNFATLDTSNSIAVLSHAASVLSGSTWQGVVPEGANVTSGIQVRIRWRPASATTGNVRWRVSVMSLDGAIGTDSYDTAVEASSAAPGTLGNVQTASITVTTIASIAAGSFYRIRVERVGSDAVNDTMTGAALLVAFEVRGVA